MDFIYGVSVTDYVVFVCMCVVLRSVALVCRVYEGGVPYSYWIRRDGIRWVFREVDLHSDQQHHRWVWLGNASYLIYAFGCVWLDSIVALELDNPIPIPIPIPKLGCFFDIMYGLKFHRT